MEFPLTRERFEGGKLDDLAEEVYQKVLDRFKQKTEIMAANAYRVVKVIYENNREQITDEMMMGIPVVAGNRQYGAQVNIVEAYQTECRSVVTAFHKALILHTIDEAWKENLRLLDELKHSVHNASYEQKDPLLIFKLESVKLFDDMVNTINDRTVSIIMRAMIPELNVQPEPSRQQTAPQQRRPQYQESRGEMTDAAQQQAAARDTRDRQPVQPIRVEKLPGRNDPCPCGSGKKFKQCHGRNL